MVSLELHISPRNLSVCVYVCVCVWMGFPHGSDSKQSSCNAGDSGLIPGSGRSPGEGNGYPLQYSCLEKQRSLTGYSPWGPKEWVSLIAQRVRSSPSMPETQVRALGREDPLEKGMATHSSVPAWRIPSVLKFTAKLSRK